MNEFDPWDYAYTNCSETLNYMSDEEKDEISSFDNAEDLSNYLHMFYERT